MNNDNVNAVPSAQLVDDVRQGRAPNDDNRVDSIGELWVHRDCSIVRYEVRPEVRPALDFGKQGSAQFACPCLGSNTGAESRHNNNTHRGINSFRNRLAFDNEKFTGANRLEVARWGLRRQRFDELGVHVNRAAIPNRNGQCLQRNGRAVHLGVGRACGGWNVEGRSSCGREHPDVERGLSTALGAHRSRSVGGDQHKRGALVERLDDRGM